MQLLLLSAVARSQAAAPSPFFAVADMRRIGVYLDAQQIGYLIHLILNHP